MRLKTVWAVTAAVILSVSPLAAGPVQFSREYKQAVNLYEGGLFEEARILFERISRTQPNELSEGYEVLCAIQTRADGYEGMIARYEQKYGKTPISTQIDRQYGHALFDGG